MSFISNFFHLRDSRVNARNADPRRRARRGLRPGLAVACALFIGLTMASPASAHTNSQSLDNSACGGWVYLPQRCGTAEVRSDHASVRVFDTAADGRIVWVEAVMTSGRTRSAVDPDDTGTGQGVYTEPIPSLDRIAWFRLCITKWNPYTGASYCMPWKAA
jgi:hypothetical protein